MAGESLGSLGRITKLMTEESLCHLMEPVDDRSKFSLSSNVSYKTIQLTNLLLIT